MFNCYRNLEAYIFQVLPMMKKKITTIIWNVGSFFKQKHYVTFKKMVKFKFVCKFLLLSNSN